MKKYGKWIAVALLLSLVFSAVAVNYHKNGAERQNRLSLIYIPKVVDSRNDFSDPGRSDVGAGGKCGY